jgi:tRNA pseudouridine55 synthase
MISGGLALNKPAGLTSAQIGNILKPLFECPKTGHIGTLDPNATGVLIMMLGNATKVIPYVPEQPKTYIAGFRLGLTSDTYDIWGKLSEHGYSGDVPKDMISSVMEEFTGKIDQLPPMFSAKKIDGVRLYKLAYDGIELPRKPSRIEIFRLDLLSYDEKAGEGTFLLECSKGTYVRSLISDIGMSCGCGAVMTSLIRTRDMGFNVDDCVTLEQIKESPDRQSLLIPMHKFISHIPQVELSDIQANRIKFGNNANFQGFPAPSGTVRLNWHDELYAIGKLVNSTGEIIPERLI